MSGLGRVELYLVCLYANELDVYHEKVRGKRCGWYNLPKADRIRIYRKARDNGLFS